MRRPFWRDPVRWSGDLLVAVIVTLTGLIVWLASRGLASDPATGEHPGPAGVLLMLAGLGMMAWVAVRRD